VVRWLACVVALAACSDPPPLVIKYALTTDASQLCYANVLDQTPAQSCSDVEMPCQAVLDLRIVSASDPTKQFIKVCQVISGRPNLCSIAGIDLPKPTGSVPEQTLAVEVAVYRDDAIPHDPDTSDPICPDDLEFSPDGLPLSSSPSPAVGGRAFYHPGDTETVVHLGCTDELALQDKACTGANTTQVTATVDDFDTNVSVPVPLADHLSVFVGEPLPVISGSNIVYSLDPVRVRLLDRTVAGPIPGWGAAVDLPLVSSDCVEVIEDVPQATPSLVCRSPVKTDIPGVRLSKATLDQILAALQMTEFPADGLVVGIVLDNAGNPAADATVTTSDPAADIAVLSADRRQVLAGATTSSGIFLSTRAPYNTTFTAHTGSTNTPTVFGGLVAGKVTIEILQFTQPTAP
jgi:hypothetical protein